MSAPLKFVQHLSEIPSVIFVSLINAVVSKTHQWLDRFF